MNPILTLLAKNKHTTLAGAAFFAIEPAAELAMLWFPSHKDQIEQTSKILKGAIAGYGLLMAGDAGAGASKDEVKQLAADVQATKQAVATGDTTLLTRADAGATPGQQNKPL